MTREELFKQMALPSFPADKAEKIIDLAVWAYNLALDHAAQRCTSESRPAILGNGPLCISKNDLIHLKITK